MSCEDARYWDGQAAAFDDEPDHGLRDPGTYAAWERLLADTLPAPPADIADLGSGTGTLALLMARLGHRVVGIDLSPAMVERARVKARADGTDVTFEVGDISDPPLADSSLDAVVVRHVLWALPQPGTALDRWLTELRPGGRLVLVEGHWDTRTGLRAETVLELLRERAADVQLRRLTESVYWGKDISDERYLVTAVRPSP